MISVIVPVYKAEMYLRRCIDSILAQTYKDFELLLIDDGSPDNCGAICDEYAAKDSRVHVFHKENGGVSSARNLGLDNARGEWIAFVDSDDWIGPSYLEELVKGLDSDWVIGGYVSIPDGEKCSTKDYSYDRNSFGVLIERHQKDLIRSPWGSLLKLSIIKDNGISFDSKVRLGEDTIFNYQYLYYCNSVRTISVCEYYYYSGDGLVSFAKKYSLSLEEVNYTLKKIVSTKQWLRGRVSFDIEKDLAIDYYAFINLCSVSKMVDRQYFDDYCQLCKEISPSLSSREFYSSELFSPIIRGVAELKELNRNRKIKEANDLYKSLTILSKEFSDRIFFKNKDFFLWYFLIKRGYYNILCVLMRCYGYMKDLKFLLTGSICKMKKCSFIKNVIR